MNARRRTGVRFFAALLLGGALTASFVIARARAQAPTAAQASLPAPADPAGVAAAAAEADQGQGKQTNPTTPTVRLVFRVVPPNIATVTWGNKRLGIIKPKAPLIIERPRDSGPMDVVFKSQGYVTVHTRVYTFTNNTLAVKLTPLDKKNTLYGYREELPPEVTGAGGAGGAGGMPPTPAIPAVPGATPAPGAGTP